LRILFLSAWFPYPPDNGSKIRIFNLIRELSRRHEITLVSFAAPGEGERLGEMEDYCARVVAVPQIAFRPGGFQSALGLLAPVPRSVVATYSRKMRVAVEEKVSRVRPDIILSSELGTAPYAGLVKGVPRLLEELEVTVMKEQFTKEARPLVRLRRRLTWWKFRHYVRGLLRSFDACTAVSEKERQEIREMAPEGYPVEIVPNGVDVSSIRPNGSRPQGGTLIFPGALTYSANLDAMQYFLAEVYPLIRKRCPQVTLTITGGYDGVALNSLRLDESVSLSGHVPDIHPLVGASWACIVPLRIGGGTRLKILEAMALGTPVVATSKGAEGLDVTDGRNILLADGPEAFAEATLRLLGDPSLRASLAQEGRALVEAKYGWEEIGRKLDRLIETVVARKAG